ncbi:hypothetical protein HanIR_Chr03g0145861 [Helianthus annuus]|nr:hypothetical protein HanIR_Chr03g0145861 [Helianthus annuus]KAJ0769828.1 putative protein NDR1 [Helianthus annuus]
MTRCADVKREARVCTLICFFTMFFILIAPLIGYFFLTLHEFLLFNSSLSFTLLDVKLYAFNASTTTSTLQINISYLNDDDFNGFHFDNTNVYAYYKSQQITLPTMLPPAYLEEQNFTRTAYLYPPVVAVWSPYLNGTEVPLSPLILRRLWSRM